MLSNGDISDALSNLSLREGRVNGNHNLSALVVDDAPLIRMMHEVHLQVFGFRVQVVENGKQAVDLIQSGASFYLILIDKEMPVMNGLEATKELREMGVDSMIVGAATCRTEYEKQIFMEAGLDHCFGKPITADKIRFILEELHKKINNGN